VNQLVTFFLVTGTACGDTVHPTDGHAGRNTGLPSAASVHNAAGQIATIYKKFLFTIGSLFASQLPDKCIPSFFVGLRLQSKRPFAHETMLCCLIITIAFMKYSEAMLPGLIKNTDAVVQEPEINAITT
jgi:hypothetical protein